MLHLNMQISAEIQEEKIKKLLLTKNQQKTYYGMKNL